jgi:hypothetical protein
MKPKGEASNWIGAAALLIIFAFVAVALYWIGHPKLPA